MYHLCNCTRKYLVDLLLDPRQDDIMFEIGLHLLTNFQMLNF